MITTNSPRVTSTTSKNQLIPHTTTLFHSYHAHVMCIGHSSSRYIQNWTRRNYYHNCECILQASHSIDRTANVVSYGPIIIALGSPEQSLEQQSQEFRSITNYHWQTVKMGMQMHIEHLFISTFLVFLLCLLH